MDINMFNSNDFNSKEWINNAWRHSESSNKQDFVATTLSHLQVYKKQLSNNINETLVQLQSQMQKYKKDTRVMATQGSGLHEQLVWLNETVQSVHDKTGNSIDRLQRYDNLISRLENAARALKEADKWHVLYVNLDKVLEQGVPAIGEHFTQLTNDVASVTSTLEVLSESPDYDNKLIQLEDLYNRLESALTPAVITALTQRNKENTKAYCAMFIAMDRHVSLIRLWRRVEAENLQNSNKIDYSIRQLYNDILGHAHSQIEWLTDVLKSKKPLYELLRLYTDLLLALEPSPVKVLTANLKLTSTPEESVNMIIDYKQDMDSFVTNFTKFVDTERQVKEDIPPTVYTDLGRAVFAPLREVLPKYVDYQAVILTSQLNIKELNQDDVLEKSRVIVSLVERTENWFRTAHNNARKIAANAIYPYFVPSLEAFISAICSIISSTTRQIETDFLSATVKGMAQGVLSPSFPATLILGTAVATLLDRLASLRKEVHEYLAVEGSTEPLQNLELLVLDESARACLSGFRSRREIPWSTGADDAKRIHCTLKSLALKILVEPIACQLESIPHLSAWNNNDSLSSDLPDFSISPQEYITVAGQYLMTLPQHLEMHEHSEKQTPWQFLNEVCNQTCEMFVEKLLNVRNMDPLGTKRCLSDIVYLSSVVEDLGSNVPNSLKNLENSLRNSINAETSQ